MADGNGVAQFVHDDDDDHKRDSDSVVMHHDSVPSLPPASLEMTTTAVAKEEEEEEEEKKELDQDWRPSMRNSVRGSGVSPLAPAGAGAAATAAAAKAKRTNRGNRGSLDGTRRFRKVVTFPASITSTKLIGRRTRGRNSFLPWFSSAAQSHVTETLEEQERRKKLEKEEKLAKKEQKRIEKEQKKLLKETKKLEKKAKKKSPPSPPVSYHQQQQESNREDSLPLMAILQQQQKDSTDDAPLIFEDSNDNFNSGEPFQMDDNRTATAAQARLRGTMHESMPVRRPTAKPNGRRRSSVTTAILSTMGRFALNAKKSSNGSTTATGKQKRAGVIIDSTRTMGSHQHQHHHHHSSNNHNQDSEPANGKVYDWASHASSSTSQQRP